MAAMAAMGAVPVAMLMLAAVVRAFLTRVTQALIHVPLVVTIAATVALEAKDISLRVELAVMVEAVGESPMPVHWICFHVQSC